MAQILINRTFSRGTLIAIFVAWAFTLVGCSKPAVIDGVLPVEISGKTFQLEIVADDATRTLGLGGRTQLDADKGMIFSFPDAQLRKFIMRDCFIDIDIIFLDASGRITAMHHMPIEEPKKPNELSLSYESRLARYSSRFNAQYAIELVGGMLEKLDLEPGQQIKLDTKYLQSITN